MTSLSVKRGVLADTLQRAVMPATVPCPMCGKNVKVPPDASPWQKLTCLGCDEVFVPLHLRVEAPLPGDIPTFGIAKEEEVGKATPPGDIPTFGIAKEEEVEESAARQERKRKVKAIETAAQDFEREQQVYEPPPTFLTGFEILLLVFAVVGGIAGVITFVVANRFPSFLESLFIVAFGGGVIYYFWRKYDTWRKYEARS